MADDAYIRKISYAEIAFLSKLGLDLDLKEMILRCWSCIKFRLDLDLSMFAGGSKGLQFTHVGAYETYPLTNPDAKKETFFLMCQRDLSRFEGLIYEEHARAEFRGEISPDSVNFEKRYINDLVPAADVNRNPIFYRGNSCEPGKYAGTWSFSRAGRIPILSFDKVHMATEGSFVLRQIVVNGG